MKKYYIIFAFLSISLLNACRGDQQNKLIGRWEQIAYTNPDSTPVKTYWQFYSGPAVTIYKDNGVVIDSFRYTYGINASVFDVFDGDDTGGYLPDARDPRGQYWVDHLSDTQFKATKRKHPDGTTGAVYMRIELVKR